MKIVSTLFFVLSFYIIFGQNNNYIVNENGLWSTVEVHCMPWGNNYSTYFIKFSEDTVIDQFTYKKAWISEDEFHSNWNFYGFIREDEEHQVFLKPPGYAEGKVYDFDVEVGDTITARNIYLNADTLHFVVTQVDSVLMLDRYRKRITLFEYVNIKEEIWIEGIGSLYGIMNSCNNAYGAACGGYESLCYEEDGTLVYQHPDYNTCYYAVTVGEDEIPAEILSVYPNPASDYITISFDDNYTFENGCNFELLTVSGEKIMEKKLSYSKNIIYLQSIKKGMYFVQIASKNRTFQRYKLIVD